MRASNSCSSSPSTSSLTRSAPATISTTERAGTVIEAVGEVSPVLTRAPVDSSKESPSGCSRSTVATPGSATAASWSTSTRSSPLAFRLLRSTAAVPGWASTATYRPWVACAPGIVSVPMCAPISMTTAAAAHSSAQIAFWLRSGESDRWPSIPNQKAHNASGDAAGTRRTSGRPGGEEFLHRSGNRAETSQQVWPGRRRDPGPVFQGCADTPVVVVAARSEYRQGVFCVRPRPRSVCRPVEQAGVAASGNRRSAQLLSVRVAR